MKIYEKVSRYFLGFWSIMCAIDGWYFIILHKHLSGTEPVASYLPELMETTYIWVVIKIVQTVGAISLLSNYKPALGVALITPTMVPIILLYLFEWKTFFIPIGIALAIANAVLIYAYWKNFKPLLEKYS